MDYRHLDIFMLIYQHELEQVVQQYPEEYGYPVDAVPGVAAKMRVAFIAGTYNKDGRAIARTCKRLGIKHTRKALDAYFRGE